MRKTDVKINQPIQFPAQYGRYFKAENSVIQAHRFPQKPSLTLPTRLIWRNVPTLVSVKSPPKSVDMTRYVIRPWIHAG